VDTTWHFYLEIIRQRVAGARVEESAQRDLAKFRVLCFVSSSFSPPLFAPQAAGFDQCPLAWVPAGYLWMQRSRLMFRSSHLPDHPPDCQSGHPISPTPTKCCSDSICAWCCSRVTLLPTFFQAVHRQLFCPACGQGQLPAFQFGLICCCRHLSWPSYDRCLHVLFCRIWFNPCALAASFMISTNFFTACLPVPSDIQIPVSL
jgi:hypothetical protein